jgi:hypothetical protein
MIRYTALNSDYKLSKAPAMMPAITMIDYHSLYTVNLVDSSDGL